MGNKSILDHLFGVIYGTIHMSGRGWTIENCGFLLQVLTLPDRTNLTFSLVTLGDYNNELN